MARVARIGWIAALALAAAIPTYSWEDPFAGAWTLTTAKSKLPPECLDELTAKLTLDDKDIRADAEWVNPDKVREKLQVLGGFDDSFYGVKGSAYFDSVSFRRLDKNHLQADLRKAGVVVLSLDARVSGTTMRVNASWFDAKGAESKWLVTLRRE